MRSRRWLVLLYSLGGIAAILLLAVAAVVVLRRTSTDESVRNARERSRVMAISVVAPALTDEAAAGDAGFVERFDGVVRNRLLPTGAVRVKVWNDRGQIVYSDEPRLIGRRFPLGADERAVLRHGGSDAGVSNLAAPENRFEARDRKLLEVYTQVRTPDGTPLLFETYFPYSAVTASRNALLRKYAPIVLVTLGVLALVQLTLAWLLARRIRREEEERERLHREALHASEQERRRIARDLHDGVVQDLVGVSFTIAGALDELGPDVDVAGRAALDDAAAATRRGISQLRTLLVDIYPPNLATEGLEAAIADLLTRAQSDGLATSLDYDPAVTLASDDQALAFRVVQEATRNTLRHGAAQRIDVRVAGNGAGRVEIGVTDDGSGFDPATIGPSEHFGLQFLHDAAARQGAELAIVSAPGRGTTVRLSCRAGS